MCVCVQEERIAGSRSENFESGVESMHLRKNVHWYSQTSETSIPCSFNPPGAESQGDH